MSQIIKLLNKKILETINYYINSCHFFYYGQIKNLYLSNESTHVERVVDLCTRKKDSLISNLCCYSLFVPIFYC